MFRDLKTCDYVLFRHDTSRNSLQMPYNLPYKVARRTDKYFSVIINGKQSNISIDRLKPAFILTEQGDSSQSAQESAQGTPAGHTHRTKSNLQQPENLRKSQRRVRFTNPYQAGFN